MRAGALSRPQTVQRDQREDLFNDALIVIDATKHGLPMLSRNIQDFGLFTAAHRAGAVVQV